MTVVGNVSWLIELFSFENQDPFFDSEGTDSLTGVVELIATDAAKIVDSADKPGSDVLKKGVVGISFSRSKQSPNGDCSLTFVGPLPRSVVVGTWVVVSTTIGNSKGTPTPRFFGQIYAVESSYMTAPSGLLTVRHDVRIREWSSSFTTLVQFSPTSIENAFKKDASGVLATLSTVGVASGNEHLSSAKIHEIMSASLNPYKMGQAILVIVGAISALDLSPDVDAIKLTKYSEVSTTMPSIPRVVLDRFGIDQSVSPSQPFAPVTLGKRGLVDVVTGNQTEAFKNDGSWDGVFDKDGVAAYKALFDPNAPGKPGTSSMFTLTQCKFSVWDLLNRFLEPVVNETFTDFYYERLGDGSIAVRPVVVVRDKPFLMDELKDKVESIGYKLASKWTRYEDVPRVRVGAENIIGLKIHNTFINSPNYIIPDLTADFLKKDHTRNLAIATGVLDIKRFQRRWGGQADNATLSYLTDNGVAIEEYYQGTAALLAAWHSFGYRMGTGTLIVKPGNLAISLGMNVQFNMGGDVDFVGHVESISGHMSIDENGTATSMLQIGLQRIVKVVEDGLATLDLSDFSHLGEVTAG